MKPSHTKRLNLSLSPKIDSKLREISQRTGLKLVTIISQGIEYEHREWEMAGWRMAPMGAKKGKEEGIA
jgi:hypothetical protein